MKMSEFLFGTTTEKVTRKNAVRFDKIAKIVAGKAAGFTTIHPPEGGVKSWFAIPNRGNPFDRQNANAILSQCGLPLI
jgi:hypothetical protein